MYCPDCKIEVESGEYCPLCGRKLVRDSHSTGTVVDDSFSGEAAQVSGKKRCKFNFSKPLCAVFALLLILSLAMPWFHLNVKYVSANVVDDRLTILQLKPQFSYYCGMVMGEFGDDDEEIEIEIGGDDDFDGDDVDGEEEIEIVPDDDEFEVELDESNLGYTDNYQKKTAMTTPDNHEPANPKSTYSMDGGVPTGTEKPWVGPKKKSPYDDEVNEGCEDECGYIEEGGHTVTQNGPYSRGDGKTWTNDASHKTPRNGSRAGVKEKGTADNMYSDVSESIKKKANQIFLENKQLKALMGKLQSQVNEAIVVNQSLANVIKIINENATTVNEKKDILRRFNECTTREESNKLYSVISEELKREGKTHSNVAGTINSQLSESRDRAVETPMFKSQDLSDTLNFMSRLDAIK